MSEVDLDSKMISRFTTLYNELQQYIAMCRATNYAQVNVKLLGKAIRDYFEDIERLKQFEGMKRVNEAKVYAYQTYWIMRRKPIQIVNSLAVPEMGLYLNEFICAAMMTSKMYEEAGEKVVGVDPDRLHFISLLFYNFKYRTFTQKSLELAAEAFFLGHSQK